MASQPPPSPVPTLAEASRQFGRLVRLIRPYWGRLMKGMLLGPVVGVVGMATPYLTKLLIDEVYPSQDVTLMHVLVGGILAVSVTATLMKAMQGYYTLYVNSHMSNATRLLFFNHLQHLGVGFFDRHRVGEITSRFQDVGKALQSVNKTFTTLFGQGVYLLLVPPFLLMLQWKLALVALVSVPLTIVVTVLSGRLLRRYWKQTSEAYADLNALQVEALTQVRTLKTLELERDVYERASGQIDHALQMQLRAGGFSQLFGSVNGTLHALNTALFTWLGWRFILSGQMSLGDYIAFTAYMGYLYRPLSQFVQLFSDFQQSAVNLGRMFEYLDAPAEQDPTGVYAARTAPEPVLRGDVALENVWFAYEPGEPVLRDVSLRIRSGTVTAIIGPSGSGKTSLLRLLPRLGIPSSGHIRFDGRAIEAIPLHALRRQVTLVLQETGLLRGTIWDNLTIGLDSVPRHVVDEAVAMCRLDDLIASLPGGYETSVAEWGASLSGGQRQRLALARALIRKAPLLLLDEATSNVDLETEAAILDALFATRHERTILYVTHRVATAARADEVVVIEGGRLVAAGRHDTLRHSSPAYRRLLEASGPFEENGKIAAR